jgi:hypothetical protein
MNDKRNNPLMRLNQRRNSEGWIAIFSDNYHLASVKHLHIIQLTWSKVSCTRLTQGWSVEGAAHGNETIEMRPLFRDCPQPRHPTAAVAPSAEVPLAPSALPPLSALPRCRCHLVPLYTANPSAQRPLSTPTVAALLHSPSNASRSCPLIDRLSTCQCRCPRCLSRPADQQTVEQQRHEGSIQNRGAECHLCLLRLDAQDDELLPIQSPIEALLVEQVFLVGEAELSVSLVGDPLAWSLGMKVWQIAQERLQSLLLQIRNLLRGHADALSSFAALRKVFVAGTGQARTTSTVRFILEPCREKGKKDYVSLRSCTRAPPVRWAQRSPAARGETNTFIEVRRSAS